MSGRDGVGNYTNPFPDFIAGTTINSSQVDDNFAAVAAALTGSVAADGQTPRTANHQMNGYRHTGVGNAQARDQYAAAGQVQDGAFIWCGTAGGTADAITLTPTPSITAYAAGQTFRWIAGGSANTGAATIAVSGLTTKAAQNDGSALVAGEHAAGKMYEGVYDGTAFQIQRVRTIIGAGDASGPASSTDNVWPRFDGTGGKTLQNGTWAEDDSGNVTGGGTLNMGDHNLSRADLIDTSYEVNALGDLAGGTDDIDYTDGHVQTATISTGAQTFTFSNFPAGYGALVLFLTNGGSQTITWPGTVSAAPTDLTAAGVDKLLIESPDGGTTHYVTVLGRDI